VTPRRQRGTWIGRGRAVVAVLGVVFLLFGFVVVSPVAAADPTASMTITKTASATDVQPRDEFEYSISFQCTSATEAGCVNAVVTDVVPGSLIIISDPVVTGIPAGDATSTVSGQTVSVAFQQDLGGGNVGLLAGVEATITFRVRVDPNIPFTLNGQPLVNTAGIAADNADPANASATVTPQIPLQLAAATTKSIDPAGAVADPGTSLTVALTGANTSNTGVDTLVVTDPVDPTATPNPFQYLAVTSLGPITPPPGAETVQVRAWVNGAWVDGPVGPPAALPAGVDPADVTGLHFVFTSTDGANIDPGATASIGVSLAQRPNVADLTGPTTVSNDSDTSVTLGTDTATSAPATDTYQIAPPNITVAAGKSFDPATVHAGDPSTVTLSGTNTSQLPLDSMTVTEPQPGSTNPFADGGLTFTGFGTDGNGAGIVWPQGATAATVTYTCQGSGPGPPLSTTTPDTLPGPPAGCTVIGFTVTFTDPIAPGAEATIPFTVRTATEQGTEELTRTNEVGVTGTLNATTTDATATADITTIVDRLAVGVDKSIVPSSIPSFPGQVAVVELTGTLKPFPDSTADAHQIIVQDPDPLGSDTWYAAFQPDSVTATPVPAESTLTVQYYNGTDWVDVPGMVDIAGPTTFNGAFPPEVTESAQGIRFVYTSTLDPPDGFPPGTQVKPNLTYSLRPGMESSDATVTNCAGTSASTDVLAATADPPACQQIQLVPPDLGAIDVIDKAWDTKLISARSQAEVGASLSWSTNGFSGLQVVRITDSQVPDITPLASSVFDVFDLVRVDPITPSDDPLLTYDQVKSVQLYRLPVGSTSPAAGSWVDATNDPCPAQCDGTFPGYALTAAEQADTIGFRLSYVESPTRVDRIAGHPEAPPVGTGIAPSTGNNRKIHPVFQLRDELRSNADVPVTATRVYNVDGGSGTIRNTVRLTGLFDGNEVLIQTASDDIALADIPVTVNATKSWSGGPLGIPQPGVPADRYPTGRLEMTAENTTPAKVDRLVITDPTGGTSPFDTFNLARFVSIIDPAGSTSLTVTLTRAGGGTTDYTKTDALALTEDQLTEVVGFTLTWTGRIDPSATGEVVLDTRLRATSRSTGDPPTGGQTVPNDTSVAASDLVDYPGVTPNTATDNASAGIALQQQGLGVTPTKSFTPTTQTEPDNSPATVTLTGQPSGPSRTTSMILTDAAPTFWNQYDLATLNPVSLTAPIEQVQVDAFTGGAWSIAAGQPVLTGGSWQLGSPTAGGAVTLPAGVTAGQVQGLRYTFSRTDGSNWENPANPTQTVTFQVTRRADLNTGGPVPSTLAGSTPAPGETIAGQATDTTTATVISSDVDVDGNPLTATGDATATITFEHATNAVQVSKTPDGDVKSPGTPFPYTLTVTNTGAVPITDPVITDRLPTDADGALIVLPDAGANYRYTLTPPSTAGTAMPIDPTRVTVDETPLQITFTFPTGTQLQVGESYTITFDMQTRPGLAADTAFTNSFGIVGDRPFDQCQGTLDPTTGECRASATDTVLSAGALSVHKLVKAEASDILGVIQDPLVPTKPACLTDPDGFYGRPCVPVTKPGGAITWRMHFQNTGNRPIDRIVAVDRLPAPGDKLATANLDRGSQWTPVLTGPVPTWVGDPGTLTASYTTETTACPTALGTDGTVCPEVTWTPWTAPLAPAVAATVQGVRLELAPATPLAPAATTDVDLQMTAPAFSPDAGENPIAYNTVGMSGRWVNGADTGYTLTTEPPRVGVALATGPLQVVKVVDGDAADQFAPTSFTATLECTSVGQPVDLGAAADLTLTPGAPVTVENLPWGATCTVIENPGQGETSSQATTVTIVQNPTTVPTVTLTNTYDYASLTVRKTVDTHAVDAGGTPIPYGPFTILVGCTYLDGLVYARGYGPLRPMQVELQDQQEATFTGLPAGASCTITETDDKGAVTTTFDTTVGGTEAQADGTTATVDLAPDTTDGQPANTATVTNTFAVGSVQLSKQVTGKVAATYGAGPFTVHLACTLTDDTGTRPVYNADIVLGGAQPLTSTVDNLAAGADCDVTETDNGGASTITIDHPHLTVGSGDTAAIVVINSFDPGQVVLTKKITGDAAAYAATTFNVTVTCAANGAVLPGFPITVQVTAGTDTTVPTLAGATCTATETGAGSATEVTYLPANPDDATQSGQVTVTQETPGAVAITNEYRAGGLQIAKTITGPEQSIGTGPFTFSVACSFDGKNNAYTGTVTVQPEPGATPATSPVIQPLPVGAVCVVTETGTGGADTTPPPVTVTIPDVDTAGTAQVVVAGFVNTFSAGTLQISKVLDGDGANLAADKTFTVQVTCQLTGTGAGTVTLYDGPVTIQGGETLPVTDATGAAVVLPLGAHCFATETDSGGADAVHVDFDSYQNAAVVTPGPLTQALTITVTNTFRAPPPAPGTESEPPPPAAAQASELPNTGAPIDISIALACLLLAAGALLVRLSRRRAVPRESQPLKGGR